MGQTPVLRFITPNAYAGYSTYYPLDTVLCLNEVIKSMFMYRLEGGQNLVWPLYGLHGSDSICKVPVLLALFETELGIAGSAVSITRFLLSRYPVTWICRRRRGEFLRR